MKRHLDHLATADPEAAKRMQRHLDGFSPKYVKFQMDKAVEEVLEALCIEVSFGRELADGIGRMLIKGTPENLDRYLKLVKTASSQGPTLAGIITKHLVPVLTCKDENLAGKFEKAIRTMLQKGTYTLKAPLETLSIFIESGELQSAHAFLDLLVTTYSLDLTYNRSLYLTHALPRAVKGFSARRRLWQIRGLSKIIQTDVRLTDDYLQGLASGLDLLSEKELNEFLALAIQRYRKDPESGTRFISLEAQQAKEVCRASQVAVSLSTVRSGLERYLQARTGRLVPVRKLASIENKMGAHESKLPLVHCDGQAIYVPEEMDIMGNREGNADLYKFLIRLEAGAIEFGSCELDAEKVLNTAGINPLQIISKLPNNDSDLSLFLKDFDQPQIALDLFTTFEHARVAVNVKQQYPGLSNRLQQSLAESTLNRLAGYTTGGTCYPLYQYLVLNEKQPSDPTTEPLAKAMARHLEQGLKVGHKNSVMTSAILTMEFYPTLVNVSTAKGRPPYVPLQLPLGRKMEPQLFRPYHHEIHRLASALKRDLAKQKVFVYRSDIQDILNRRNGQISAADIRRQFIRDSFTETDGKTTKIQDSDLEALICNYNLGQTATDTDDEGAYRYREWDFCMADYLPDHVRVLERRIPETESTFYRDTLNRFPGLVRTIRYAFELLRPEEITILRQWREGDDFDYRALLDFALDKKAGLMPSDRLFIKRMKRLRDVAVLLLVDLSKSTANTVDRGGTTVLDIEKQAIVLLCEALEKVGDRYAIAGFSGTGPLGVDYYQVKKLNETFTDAVKRRISAMAPQRSTRMGAAIRHATARLYRVHAKVRLILILGDGFPNDLAYKGTYAVEDTRRAILEARAEGTFVRAITVNAGDNKQLDRLYGAAHHTRIADIHDLPDRLVRVYSALTRH